MKFMKFPAWSIEWLLPVLLIIAFVTLLLGIITHFICQDWLSGLLWVVTGAAASAFLTIYAIETELFRRRSIALPALRRVIMYISAMSYRLALKVMPNDGTQYQIYLARESFRKGDALPPQIPDELATKLREMEIKALPGLGGKGLSPAERKVIIGVITWFLDDIETILKYMDRVIDMVPDTSGKLMELSDHLDVQTSILRNKFQMIKESLPGKSGDEAAWNNKEVIDFCDWAILAIVVSYQDCIEVYKVVTDAINDARAKHWWQFRK